MTKIRIFIADDHEIVRIGLKRIIEADVRFEVIGEASNGEDAIKIITEKKPDIALIDIQMPGMSGIDVCQKIQTLRIDTCTVILSAFFDISLVEACISADVRGYLLKNAKKLNLIETLISISEGQVVLDAKVSHVITNSFFTKLNSSDILTEREMSILNLLAKGFTNKEIGKALFISENTVKGHLKRILPKLSAQNRMEAVLKAKDKGIIQSDLGQV